MSSSNNTSNGTAATNGSSEATNRQEKAVEAALSLAREARQEVSQIRQERDEAVAELKNEIEALREEVKEVRSTTRLLDHVANAGQLDIETRAAICIQTAYNEAKDADGDMAYLTARDAWTALGRSHDRTRMYDVFRKAESLYAQAVDVEVDAVGTEHPIYFKKEERGHEPPSRLVVDLSNGDLRDLDLPRVEVAGR